MRSTSPSCCTGPGTTTRSGSRARPSVRLLAAKAAARQPAHLRRDIRRIRLPKPEWAQLAEARKTQGITCADMAEETGLPPGVQHQRVRDVPLHAARARLPALPRRTRATMAGGGRGRGVARRAVVRRRPRVTSAIASAAPAAWLAGLSEEDLSWLAAQDDGRDVVLYARAHRDDAISRFLPVTEELCYMLGWYLAEGSIGSRGARLNFSLGADDDRYMPALSRRHRSRDRPRSGGRRGERASELAAPVRARSRSWPESSGPWAWGGQRPASAFLTCC